MTPDTIEVRSNNCITNDPCASCGARCDPTGYDAFLAGTSSLVCDECADTRRPGWRTESEAGHRAEAAAEKPTYALDAHEPGEFDQLDAALAELARNRPTRTQQALLDRYGTKPVQTFFQADGFCHQQSDSVMAEGDNILTGITTELMSTPSRTMPVRVLIHSDADREDVRRLLTRILEDLDCIMRDRSSEVTGDLLALAGNDVTDPSEPLF